VDQVCRRCGHDRDRPNDPDQRNAIKRFLCRVGYVVIPVSILFIKYYPNVGRSYKSVDMDAPILWRYHLQKSPRHDHACVCLGSLWSFVTTWRERPARRWHHLIAQAIILVWRLDFPDCQLDDFAVSFILAGSVMIMANQAWVHRRPRSSI